MPPLEFFLYDSKDGISREIVESGKIKPFYNTHNRTLFSDLVCIVAMGQDNGGTVELTSKDKDRISMNLKDGSTFKTRKFTIVATSTDQNTLPSHQKLEK